MITFSHHRIDYLRDYLSRNAIVAFTPLDVTEPAADLRLLSVCPGGLGHKIQSAVASACCVRLRARIVLLLDFPRFGLEDHQSYSSKVLARIEEIFPKHTPEQADQRTDSLWQIALYGPKLSTFGKPI